MSKEFGNILRVLVSIGEDTYKMVSTPTFKGNSSASAEKWAGENLGQGDRAILALIKSNLDVDGDFVSYYAVTAKAGPINPFEAWVADCQSTIQAWKEGGRDDEWVVQNLEMFFSSPSRKRGYDWGAVAAALTA